LVFSQIFSSPVVTVFGKSVGQGLNLKNGFSKQLKSITAMDKSSTKRRSDNWLANKQINVLQN